MTQGENFGSQIYSTASMFQIEIKQTKQIKRDMRSSYMLTHSLPTIKNGKQKNDLPDWIGLMPQVAQSHPV